MWAEKWDIKSKYRRQRMLYHGSNKRFDVLKRHQADGQPGTPAHESLDVIYFTPDISFALVMGVQLEGVTEVDIAGKKVHFPDGFYPEKEVYIYVVDISHFPEEKIIRIDEDQVAVDLDEVTPDRVEIHKAGEVLNYYSII